MKQEEKELLLKDLCGRLPYGVKCDINDNKPYTLSSISNDYDGILIRFKEQKNGFNMEVYLSEVKPYLFPMSSMTKEQSKIYHELIGGMFGTSALINFEILEEFFNKNHIDYRGLIEKGLATDATTLNLY